MSERQRAAETEEAAKEKRRGTMRFRPAVDEEESDGGVSAVTPCQLEKVTPCDLEAEEIWEWERSGERRPGWRTCAYCGRLFEVYWE